VFRFFSVQLPVLMEHGTGCLGLVSASFGFS